MQATTKSCALRNFTLGLSAAVLLLGCTGKINSPGNNPGQDDAGPEDSELVGAGGRDLLTDWPSIALPFSDNTKMLNFEQLRNEVLRVTTLSWVDVGNDQWESNRSILGGADYSDTWQVDITPNQQKILTIRRMAFTVCGNLVEAEAGQATRTVFAVLDPAVVIDTAAASTESQVTALYKRFFFEDASAAAVTDSLALLGDLQTSDNQREAWRGLCTAYLSSMRFLSY